MKNKNIRILTFVVTFIVFVIVMFVGSISSKEKKTEKNDSVTTSIEDFDTDVDIPVYTHREIETRVMKLANTDEENQSLNRLIDPLNKGEKVNVGFVKKMVETIGLEAAIYDTIIDSGSDTMLVSMNQFDEIYNAIVLSERVDGLRQVDCYIFDTFVEQRDGVAVNIISDGFSEHIYEGYLPDIEKDTIITFYEKDNTLFYKKGYGDTAFEINNVWVKSCDGNSVTFVYEDIEKTYPVSFDIASDTDSRINLLSDVVASISFDNTGVLSLVEQKNCMDATVINVMDTELSVLNKGNYTISEDFQMYDTYETFSCSDSVQLLLGHKKVTLVLEGKTVIAAIIKDELACDDIRVIISNNDFSSYDMDTVTLCFACDTTVVDKEEQETVMTAGSIVTYSVEDFEKGDVLKFTPNTRYGKICIQSLERSYGHPCYEGTLEIRLNGEALQVVNELPLEDYLCSVVASEMPVFFEEEALKAAAICARGYAYSKLQDKSFENYYANLDDSTLCQVYNNAETTKAAVKAVHDTYAIVPIYENDVIVPLYFSTSCGITCTNEEVWGGSAYPYLESNIENLSKDKVDLSDEDTFRQFIQDSLGYDTIENNMPYYRWSVSFSVDEISDAINLNLADRIQMSPDNIKVKNEKEKFVKKEINDIGQVVSIAVTERTVSGVVANLIIEGTKETISVSGQTNIRNLISPKNQEIVKQDGSVVKGWTSLPSPFYYVEQTGDTFTIYGGGFGHGVGMSQNGANALAKQGYNYKYILHHYYSCISFTTIYEANGEEE